MKSTFQIELTQLKMHIPTTNWYMDIFVNGCNNSIAISASDASALLSSISVLHSMQSAGGANIQNSTDKSYVYYVPDANTTK